MVLFCTNFPKTYVEAFKPNTPLETIGLGPITFRNAAGFGSYGEHPKHKRSHACWGEPEMHYANTQSAVAFGGCDEISGRRHWPAERILQEAQVDTSIAQNKHFST